MNYNRLQIAKKKAREVFRNYHGYYPENMPAYQHHLFRGSIDTCIGIYRKTKVICSSPYCCGNPRRGKGMYENRLTVQERKAPTVDDFKI